MVSNDELQGDIVPSQTTTAAPSSESLRTSTFSGTTSKTKQDSPVDTNIPAQADQPFKNQTFEDEKAQSPAGVADSTINATTAAQDPNAPPNGGYGWVIVLCTALINGHTWGINSSYGVFLSYYLSNNVFPGAAYLDYAFIGGLSIACAGLVAPIATYTTGHFNTRTTLLIGVFFETLSLIGASFAYESWQLFLSQGACFGFGMGFLFVGSVGLVPQWFTTKRSLANGFAAAGSGFGGLTYSLAVGAMIPQIGLAWSFRVLGIVTCVVNTCCALLIRDRNKQVGAKQIPFDYKLFKRTEFILLEAWVSFSILGYVVLLFSLPNYVVSVGLNPQQGAVIGALLNLGQGLGRPVVGMVSDAGGRINLASILTAICGLFCFVIWIFAKSYGVLIFFSLIIGTVAGTVWTTIGPVAAEVVGLQNLPSALNLTWLCIVLPSLFSEVIGLEILSASQANPTPATTGNPYLYTQIFTALMYLIAAGCGWALRAWKIGQLEVIAAEKGERPAEVSALENEDSVRAQAGARVFDEREKQKVKSSFVYRLFAFRVV